MFVPVDNGEVSVKIISMSPFSFRLTSPGFFVTLMLIPEVNFMSRGNLKIARTFYVYDRTGAKKGRSPDKSATNKTFKNMMRDHRK